MLPDRFHSVATFQKVHVKISTTICIRFDSVLTLCLVAVLSLTVAAFLSGCRSSRVEHSSDDGIIGVMPPEAASSGWRWFWKRKAAAPDDVEPTVATNDAAVAVPLSPDNQQPAIAESLEKDGIAASPDADQARLRPGLIINVTVLVAGKNEIDAMGKRVSDKGAITLPFLGNVAVNNMTLEELGQRLAESYREYLVNPQVIVEFIRDDNKEGLSPWGSVTLLGRVKNPGRISIPATRDLTLSAAIQKAGGFDTSAKVTAIRVTHRLPDGSLQTREVNFLSVGALGLAEEDVLLEPDDIVFVPELVF